MRASRRSNWSSVGAALIVAAPTRKVQVPTVNWVIEYERCIDGAVFRDHSATSREIALAQAVLIINQGHDVRSITAPDDTSITAEAVAIWYNRIIRDLESRSRTGGDTHGVTQSVQERGVAASNLTPILRGPAV